MLTDVPRKPNHYDKKPVVDAECRHSADDDGDSSFPEEKENASAKTMCNRGKDEVECNSAQEELLRRAQALRKEKEEAKAKELKATEKKRDKELMKDGGLFKKGFLNSNSSK